MEVVVTIEDLTPEHFDPVAKWLTNKSINRWLTPEWRDRDVTGTVLAMAMRNRKNRLFLVRCEGRPCGVVALADIDSIDKVAMVWYALGDHTFAGRGITSKAVRELARLAFKELGLKCVYAWAMQDNRVSMRVLQKAGFREVGRIRSAASSAGSQVDRVYFDIVAEECDHSLPA